MKLPELERGSIPLAFLLNTATLPSRATNTVVPQGFKVTKLSKAVARGAYKPRSGACGGAKTTGALAATADRRGGVYALSRTTTK